MGASTAVLIVVFPINIALNIFLIHYTSLGILGSPLALSLTYWFCFGLLGLWTSFSSAHKQNATWDGFQPSAVFHPRSCYLFLKLAIPGILMVGTEWFDKVFLLPIYVPIISSAGPLLKLLHWLLAVSAHCLWRLSL
jgi:MATE family multidrug resistance protein